MFRARVSALHHPARAVVRAPLLVRACWVLVGACNPTLSNSRPTHLAWYYYPIKAPAYDEDVDGVDDSRPLSALLKTASVARRRNDAVRVGIVMLQEPAVTVSADAVATAATMANAAVASVAAAAAAAAAGSMIASAPGRKKKIKSKKAAGTTELPSFTQTKLPSPKVGKGSSPKVNIYAGSTEK